MRFFLKNICRIKKNIIPLHRKTEINCVAPQKTGVVVQLVRIPACHAGGRGFESRPYRRGERRLSNKSLDFYSVFFYA